MEPTSKEHHAAGPPHGHGGAGGYTPHLIAWEVTRACPLNCRHCRAAASRAKPAGEFSTEECFRLLDEVAAFAKPIIILTGGEPMLREDIYDIASHAHGLGLPVVMAPCGMLLNDESARRIVASGIRRISLSLDGATAGTHDAFRGYPGSFAGVVAGIGAARRAGLDFQINTTVSRHNRRELEQILQLSIQLGASVFNPFLLVPTGRGRDLAEQELSAEEYEETLRWLAAQQSRTDIRIRVTCAPHYQRILRQSHAPLAEVHGSRGCMGGKGFAFISHVGKVQICGFLDVECGDLRTEGLDFRKIWNESEVFRRVRDVDAYRGRCGVCEFRRVCGGCRARAWAMTGDYLAEEPFCSYPPKGAVMGACGEGVSPLRPAAVPAAANGGSDESHPIGLPLTTDASTVAAEMDDLDRRLLEEMQSRFPVVRHPYEALAARLGATADDLLARARRLAEAGVIRRLGGVFSPARLGYVSTLAAAKVLPDRLGAVAAEVSRLASVTHNYAREHAYNLWFTITCPSRREMETALDALRAVGGVEDLQSLPTVKTYKIAAVFLLGDSTHVADPCVREDASETPEPAEAVELDGRHQALVRLVQESLPLDVRPMEWLARAWNAPVERVIVTLRHWLETGVMRRFGAVLSHRRVGLVANGMAMFRTGQGRADELGALLAARPEVSHCYRRRVPAGWPGDLFAMIHGRDREAVTNLAKELAARAGAAEVLVLFSMAEYKKTSMRFFVAGPR